MNDLNKLVHERRPEGKFYAEENSPEQETTISSGDIERTMTTVSISTADDIWGLVRKNDLVKYRNRIWRVQSITRQSEWRKSQFAKRNNCGIKIINLVS